MADSKLKLPYYTTDVRQFEYPHRIPKLVGNPRMPDIDDMARVPRYSLRADTLEKDAHGNRDHHAR